MNYSVSYLEEQIKKLDIVQQHRMLRYAKRGHAFNCAWSLARNPEKHQCWCGRPGSRGIVGSADPVKKHKRKISEKSRKRNRK